MAFEKTYGPDFCARLPAASAVGRMGNALTVAFVAFAAAPRHFESPVQVPAYRYPSEHGPRAPSFARATLVAADGLQWGFVSGTAAIRGHASQHPRDTRRQLEVTLENLRHILAQCGLGGESRPSGRARRHIRVYVKHPEELELIVEAVRGLPVLRGDAVTYLQAEMCRRELSVEIEITDRRPAA